MLHPCNKQCPLFEVRTMCVRMQFAKLARDFFSVQRTCKIHIENHPQLNAVSCQIITDRGDLNCIRRIIATRATIGHITPSSSFVLIITLLRSALNSITLSVQTHRDFKYLKHLQRQKCRTTVSLYIHTKTRHNLIPKRIVFRNRKISQSIMRQSNVLRRPKLWLSVACVLIGPGTRWRYVRPS